MARRSRPRPYNVAPRASRSKRLRERQKAAQAPLTLWVYPATKRPRTA